MTGRKFTQEMLDEAIEASNMSGRQPMTATELMRLQDAARAKTGPIIAEANRAFEESVSEARRAIIVKALEFALKDAVTPHATVRDIMEHHLLYGTPAFRFHADGSWEPVPAMDYRNLIEGEKVTEPMDGVVRPLSKMKTFKVTR